MQTALQLFKKHPVAIIFFLLYCLLWGRYIAISFQYQAYRLNGEPSVGYGEGVAYVMIFSMLIGVIYSIIMLACGILKKESRKLILCFLIMLPIVLLFALNYIGISI